MTTQTETTNPTALLDLLGRRFHGHVETDAQLLADDATAWPGKAATEIRAARAAYAAGDLEAAAELVLSAQAAVER